MSKSELARLIDNVYAALSTLGTAPPTVRAEQQPAVAVRNSIRPDAIICLECGRPWKLLKRHITTAHNLDEVSYRKKWKLPRDYPFISPQYSQVRATLAKKNGLGRIDANTHPTLATSDTNESYRTALATTEE